MAEAFSSAIGPQSNLGFVRRVGVPLLAVALMGAGILVTFSNNSYAKAAPKKTPYKISLVGDLTGAASTVQGTATASGAFTAESIINASGGVNGRKLQITAYDSQSNTTGVGVAVRNAISNRPVAIINATNSSAFPVSVPLYTAAKFPVIADVTEVGLTSNPWFYLVTSDNPQEPTEYIAGAKQLLGGSITGKTVAIEAIQTPSIQEMVPAIVSALTAAGASVVDTEWLPIGATSFTSQAQKIAALNPSVMFIIEGPNDVLVPKAMLAAGYQGPMIGNEGASGLSIFQAINSPQYYATSPVFPVQPGSAVYKAVLKAGESPSGSYVSAGFEMMYVIKAALSKCKNSCGPKAFEHALNTIGQIKIPYHDVVAGPKFTATSHAGVSASQLWYLNSSGKEVRYGSSLNVQGLG